MRRGRSIVALLGCACAGFVPPQRPLLAEIVGVYAAEGTHPDGSSYAGMGTITRLGSGAHGPYEVRFDMPNGVFRALCLRDRELLGCAWGAERNLVVGLWRTTLAGLAGVWTRDGRVELGRELGSGDPFVAKVATVGIDTGGAAYDASLTAVPQGSFYSVHWTRAGGLHGYGLRVGSTLVGAFAAIPSAQAGVAFYRIGANGRQLIGAWTDPNQSSTNLGTETLTR